MKNIKKLLISLSLASMFMIAPAFTQVESAAHYSNAYNATARTARTDAENYLDVRYFDTVKFDKAFVYTNISKPGFQLGFAKRFNDYYFASFYNGGFWQNSKGSLEKYNQTSSTSNWTSTTNTNSANGNNNRLIFLLGLPNKMGLKFDTWLAFNNSNSKSKISASDANLNFTSNHSGAIAPHTLPLPDSIPSAVTTFNNEYEFNLLWSCYDIEKEKVNIKPWTRIGIDIYDKRKITTSNYTLKDATRDQSLSLVENDYSNFLPKFSFNFGTDIALKTKSNFSSLFGVEYVLNVDIIKKLISETNEKFTDNLNSANNRTTKTVINKDGAFNFTNTIKGMYNFSFNPTEKLTLNGKVGLSTSVEALNFGDTIKTVTDSQGKQTKYQQSGNEWRLITGNEYISNYYDINTTISSYFRVSINYNINPSFILNLGYSGTIPDLYISSSHSINKNKDQTYKNKKTSTFVMTGSYSDSITAGFTWLAGPYCTLNFGTQISPSLSYFSRTPSLNTIWNQSWSIDFTFKM